MHTLLKVTMSDLPAANEAINQGRLQKIVEQTSKLIAAEASFFYAENGYRTALFIFDMKDSSMIPSIAEPFFTELNAKVELFPAMDTSEMVKGLDMWKKKSDGMSASLS
jgi:hypothetical protein